MTTETFDPIAAVRRLEAAGMPRDQAEAVVACDQASRNDFRADLATKADLAQLETRIEAKLERALRIHFSLTIGIMVAVLTIFEFLRG